MLKKTVIGIAAGFLSVEVLVRLLAPILGQPLEYYEPVAQAKVTQLAAIAAEGRQIDYLFVGSSTVLEGVDIEAFEASAGGDVVGYNAALNAADTHIVRRFLLEELLPIIEPRTVLYGISPGSFITGTEPQIARYDSAPATRAEDPSMIDRLAGHLYMYEHRNSLTEPLTVNTILRSIRTWSTDQGIIERFTSDLTARGDTTNRTEGFGADDPIAQPAWRNAEPQDIPAHSARDLAMIAEELADDGINLLFVLMPSASPDPAFLSAVNRSADELGLQVIDATEAIETSGYFYDGVHLNKEGARVLGTYLGRQISQRK